MLRRTARVVFSARSAAYAAGTTVTIGGVGYYYLNAGPAYPPSTLESRRPPPPWTPPTRKEMLDDLKSSNENEFDLLIVGGGATGAGVAVDAATRGLRVALVEREDFSSGTSSKSTKLVHGGVRYLQKAIFELDWEQYKLVREALHERKIFLETAPYLSHMLPIMLPIYKYWQIPYYWAGCKLYDVIAGKENMEQSYLMSKSRALEAFPMLKSDGLVGALVYYDGQHNDSRMNTALIMTAVKHGANVTNYTEVVKLHKDAAGKLYGARVKDNLSGDEWDVKCKGIINATGPFADALLTLDNPEHKPIVQASSGIHITLPNYYSPRNMGLLDPATSDGRVIFFLPWQGNTIAGTTDTAANVERDPVAQEEEIRWVLDEVRRYLAPDIKVRRGDVLSAWSGLRPLVRNPAASSTEGLVRNHMIYVSPSGLLTIAGGKWTTYRSMAMETVDEAVKVFGLKPKNECVTEKVKLVGSDAWSRNMFIGLVQRYGLETEVAKHLADNYGDRAWTVCSLAEATGASWPVHGIRLSPAYPYIEAEVRYAVKHEYAQTAIDVIARRTRLSFLNAQAALDTLPRVVDIMAEEYGWSSARKASEISNAVVFLTSMGLPASAAPGAAAAAEPKLNTLMGRVEHALYTGLGLRSGSSAGSGVKVVTSSSGRSMIDAAEMESLKAAFRRESSGTSGERLPRVSVLGLVKSIPGFEGVSNKEYDYVLVETGLKSRDDVDMNEFVEICAELKEVSIAPTPRLGSKEQRRRIPVERSGGGT